MGLKRNVAHLNLDASLSQSEIVICQELHLGLFQLHYTCFDAEYFHLEYLEMCLVHQRLLCNPSSVELE